MVIVYMYSCTKPHDLCRGIKVLAQPEPGVHPGMSTILNNKGNQIGFYTGYKINLIDRTDINRLTKQIAVTLSGNLNK